jgi:hypothetical protein
MLADALLPRYHVKTENMAVSIEFNELLITAHNGTKCMTLVNKTMPH